MTFDGKHPCELCKLVEKELETSDQDDQRAPEKNPDLKLPPVICWAAGIRLHRLSHETLSLLGLDDRARCRRERPPLPPPRAV